jgi:hypothetical protein
MDTKKTKDARTRLMNMGYDAMVLGGEQALGCES